MEAAIRPHATIWEQMSLGKFLIVAVDNSNDDDDDDIMVPAYKILIF